MYIGVTSDIKKRIYEHKNSIKKGFAARYNLDKLVHYETLNEMIEAIKREKQLKKWKRDWKIELIESNNKEWSDLYDSL